MSRRGLHMLLSVLLMAAGFLWVLREGGPSTVPSHLPLSSFPEEVGGWTGVRVPIDKKTAAILNADSVTSILYRKEGNGVSSPQIFFFGVYYDHQTPEKNIHSPENCLPSSGWAVLERKIVSLNLIPGEPSVPVSYDLIQKGLERQVVLYWYQERGRTFSNEYLGRYYMIRDALLMHRTDGAMVRVSMPVTTTPRAAFVEEVSFIQGFAPLLSRYIPGKNPERLALRRNFPESKETVH